MSADIDEEKFLEKTENEIKNYDVMKSVFSKIYETELELYKKRTGAFEDIKNINEEDKGLKKIYETFTDKLLKLENTRDSHMTNIKSKLIPSTEEFVRTIKNSKKDIGNYKSTKIKTKKQEEEKRKLDISGDKIKGSQIEQNLKQSQIIMDELGNNIQRGIMSYEHDRIDNNKLIILHFINYEMAYHAKALEELTDLFRSVKNTEFDSNNNEENSDNEDIKGSKMKNNRSKINKSSVKKSTRSAAEENEIEEDEEEDEDKNKKSKKKDNEEEDEDEDKDDDSKK